MHASIGKYALAKIETTCNQAILGIQTKSINNEFLYHFLSFNEKRFLTMEQTRTQTNLNKEIVENLEISIPEPNEQDAIATILSDIDREINVIE